MLIDADLHYSNVDKAYVKNKKKEKKRKEKERKEKKKNSEKIQMAAQ